MNDDDDTLVHSQFQEIRRGSVVIAALALLRVPQYGYALLEQLSSAGIEVEANTLYPLLRRLEKQGLLTAEWTTDEARPRKYYRTSAAGVDAFRRLVAEWRRVTDGIDGLTRMETNNADTR
jgi:DNA-binding PadR family transcriptional regulator